MAFLSLFFSIYHWSAALGLYFSRVPRTWPTFPFLSHHVITRILTTSLLVEPLHPPWAPKASSQHGSQMSLLKQKRSYLSPAQMLQQPLSHLCERQKAYNDPHNLQSLAQNLWSLQPILSTQVPPTYLQLELLGQLFLSIELTPSPSSSLYLNTPCFITVQDTLLRLHTHGAHTHGAHTRYTHHTHSQHSIPSLLPSTHGAYYPDTLLSQLSVRLQSCVTQ